MNTVKFSEAGGRSRTMTGGLAALIGSILLLVGVSVPVDELSDVLEKIMLIIGGIAQVVGIVTAMYARYSRGDITVTGKKVADTKVEVTPAETATP